MWAIECIFYHKDASAATAQRNSWVGKPGFLGGYVRIGAENSPLVSNQALGYWAASDPPPNASLLPSWCKLVQLNQPSLNFVLGIV